MPGNRVLLRAPNTPMLVAATFAVIKAGGIVVCTMPMLRAKELAYPLAKAKIGIALCDGRLADEMEKAKSACPQPLSVAYWGEGGTLEGLMAKPGYETFEAADTAQGRRLPHRASPPARPASRRARCTSIGTCCRSATLYSRNVLRPLPTDRFIGSPPLAFTFGLGGLVLFPLRIGASAVLLEAAPPDKLLPAIAAHRATICFTAPTAYRAMLPKLARP